VVSPVQGFDPWVLAVAALLSVLGTARATRLWIHDAWPPVVWARERYLAWAEQTRPIWPDGDVPPGLAASAHVQRLTWRAGWAPLATCPFCVAPWLALGSILWALASGLDADTWAGGLWWLVHLWFTVAYLAAMVVVRDEPA
jgi:hypothetical protein